MIEIKDVDKIIQGKLVLDKISLKINDNTLVLLSGHNGCGKTMLLRLIVGFIKPTEGSINIFRKVRFGVIIENPSFFLNETALYNMKYLAKINNIITEKDILEWLKKFGLYEVRNNKVKTFSLGMKQRLALCQAFMENPDILLLDEPFNAIDEENLKKVINLIYEFKNKGKIIIVASHGNITNCRFDMIVKMKDGKIIKNQTIKEKRK